MLCCYVIPPVHKHGSQPWVIIASLKLAAAAQQHQQQQQQWQGSSSNSL
jgi:hypothetical protein